MKHSSEGLSVVPLHVKVPYGRSHINTWFLLHRYWGKEPYVNTSVLKMCTGTDNFVRVVLQTTKWYRGMKRNMIGINDGLM